MGWTGKGHNALVRVHRLDPQTIHGPKMEGGNLNSAKVVPVGADLAFMEAKPVRIFALRWGQLAGDIVVTVFRQHGPWAALVIDIKLRKIPFARRQLRAVAFPSVPARLRANQ